MNPIKVAASFLPFVVAASWGGLAQADDTTAPSEAPAQTKSETVTQKGGPSTAMLTSGIVTFGVTYAAAAIVAGESNRSADKNMFVPVAGPWMAMFNRGGCGGSSGRDCNTETTYKVLIVADGIGQALGALMFIDAFLNPETITTSRTTTASEKPKVRIAPSSVGSGYGMLAVGSF